MVIYQEDKCLPEIQILGDLEELVLDQFLHLFPPLEPMSLLK